MKRVIWVLLVLSLLAAACGSDSESDSGAAAPDPGGSPAAPAPPAAPAEAAPGSEAGASSGRTETAEEMTSESSPTPLADSEGTDAGLDRAPGTSAAAEAPPADEYIEEPPIEPLPTVPPETRPERPQAQSGLLTAGDVDDNLNFEFFNQYLGRAQQSLGQSVPSASLTDRVLIEVAGPNGLGLANARVEVTAGQQTATVFTNSAGVAAVFPGFMGLGDATSFDIAVTDAVFDETLTYRVDASNGEPLRLAFDAADGQAPRALDLALVLDVTGSMSDELRYLTTEFESIVATVAQNHPNVDMRFALVAYRDQGDDFVTRAFDFTGDVNEMRQWLFDQQAGGGGDYPEAMGAALGDANELSWRSGDVARVVVLNADAPPHGTDMARTLDEAEGLRTKGVRMYSLAASGVGDEAEYLMRVMAATTGGRHLFLTDDSGVGNSHQEPKTQCYVVTALDDLLVRVLQTELTGQRVEPQFNDIIREVGTYDRGVCAEQ